MPDVLLDAGDLGQTAFEQRAAFALLLVLGQRRLSLVEEIMQAGRRCLRLLTQRGIKFDFIPAFALAIEESPARHLCPEHLLQAHRLSTKLYPVLDLVLANAALVLNGIGLPEALSPRQ